MVKLYDKRLIDSKAKNWIGYEILKNENYFYIYDNIFSMIWDLFWKRNNLISMNIVDRVIVDNKPLMKSMFDNIILTYLETCLESK